MKTRARPLVSRWDVGTEGPPRLRLSLPVSPPTVRGASGWDLGWWVVSYAAVWVTLGGVIPAFQKMFTEVGFDVAPWTEILLAVSAFALSPLGLALGILVAVASIVAFWRLRRRPTVRQAFKTLAFLAMASVPIAFSVLYAEALRPRLLQKL
jgi:small basic protein